MGVSACLTGLIFYRKVKIIIENIKTCIKTKTSEADLKRWNKEQTQRKEKRILWSFLLILLLCAGCGQQAGNEASVDREEVGNSSQSDILPGVSMSPSEGQVKLEVAPLLQYEDPETQNLAGMLQEVCGGMMVQLEAGRYLGSGILYKQEEECLVILTAAHVLADVAEVVKVTFVDGWVVESTDFQLSKMADTAVVRVPLNQIPPDQAAGYYLANVDKTIYDNILSEDGCIVMGCRTGVAEDAYEGIVLEPWIYMEDYSQYMMWVSAAGKPGMSGGGLFDKRGRFLGILSGRSEDGEWAVVPLGFVLAEYG